MDLEEQKDSRRIRVNLPASLAGVVCGLVGLEVPAGVEGGDKAMNWWRTIKRRGFVRSTEKVGRETAVGVL